MKRLTTLFLIAGVLILVLQVEAVEHSALSNLFILDTRDGEIVGGLEHSALSNIFILDTRDAPSANLLLLDPNPNPPELQVMSDGVGYLYYRAVSLRELEIIKHPKGIKQGQCRQTTFQGGADERFSVPMLPSLSELASHLLGMSL